MSPSAAGKSRTRRDLLALAAALAAHAVLFGYITQTPAKKMFHDVDRVPVEVTLVKPPPAVKPIPPAPTPPAPTTPPPPMTREHPRDAPIAPPDAPVPPDAPLPDAATTTPTTVPSTDSESVVRLPRSSGAIGRVLGTRDSLAASTSTLERSLDIRSDGPMSDAKRASRTASHNLQRDMADDEVTAGLADDYFRDLKNHVETNWRPAVKDLNDGGKDVTQLGMMKSVVEERTAWDEMWRAYMDLAKQYANGVQPRLEAQRIERLRELMRSRKGMFRFHAITEAVLTQGPDGKVVTIEIPLSSGHPGIDEEVKDAITTAVNAMEKAPPARVTHGSSFTSTWRMRATWTMVPPTALLTGAGFDITSKGLHVDMPFDITLKTYVMLLRTDAHAHDAPASSAAADEP